MKYFATLRKIGIPLFLLTLAGTALDQWLTQKMEILLMNPEGTSNWVWFYGAASLILNLTFPLLGILIVLSVLRKESLFVFLRNTLNQNLIEEMRGWGFTIIWSFALIIPGFIRFLQYMLVPFVVCLDPQYETGQVDALAQSRRLSKGHLWTLFGLFAAFTLAGGLLTFFDDWRVLWKTPLPAILICFVEMLLNLWFIQWLYKVYLKGVAYDESSLSMERH